MSLTVTLFCAEIILRIFQPQDLIIPMPAIADRELIYRLPPNASAYLKGTSVRWFHLKTNSLGLRDREIPYSKPPGTSRVLLLGDSMSMAEGVELEETYIKQFEKLSTERSLPKKVETINAAIRGYGNDQETILFERLGKQFQPDMVILAFYEGNDLTDNSNGGIFTVKNGKLVQSYPTEENSVKLRYYSKQIRIQNFPGYTLLVSHSHLANLIRITYANYLNRQNIKTKFGTQSAQNISESEWVLTSMILERWIEDCKSIQARPIILYIPTIENVQHGRSKGTRSLVINRKMQALCASHRLVMIDLLDSFIAYPEPARLYLKDGHLSPEGHILTAEIMLNAYLKAQRNDLH